MNANFDVGVDYFAVLGVHFGANPQSVKQAYRRMARRYHPDVSKIHNAQARFQEIANAYEVLHKYRDAYCLAYQRALQSRLRRCETVRNSPSEPSKQAKTNPVRKSQERPHRQPQTPPQDFRQTDYSFGQTPINGKNREVVYPITLRYAIRLLRLGSFYIPGLKVQMKFTRQAFTGKTFRLKDKGYRGLFGGESGDYLVRFNIKIDEERFRLQNGDIYGNFEIPRLFIKPGKTVYIESPSGRVEWLVPENFNLDETLLFREMGLPADEQNPAGDLYAKLIPIE
ncbi:cytochrome c biogenesis protein [Thiosulfatimonas sediminis]|uniref:Cytochrome c biogenesis protein n=1 Tax=Thiosulfatimonas sediminis TaxID=2675054 RepID=A0A6F8PVI0_9GAMM|nr:DnaJ domain-containing protein [Thiosulfatimonas sediminis]BBP46047.1 cytochrome c biogenesis protein [Thiosulfatimonas sediminis]